MSFSNPYTYFAKYPFVFDDLYLIAEVDKNSGRQFLVMQKIDKRTSRVLFEDRIQCIHTAITIIPVEDFEDSVSDEEFEKDMIYIRSSEGASEFTLDIDEKFFAFRSWVAGIAESGIDAITIQSEIEQYSSLMYPIANRLFNFLLKSKVEFLQKFMEKTEKDCVLDGKPHQASLNANLLKVLDIIVLKEKEAWNAWRERVEENYNWSDDFNLYLIEQFEEFLVNIIELQPSANIFLEKDKFNFILTTEEAKFLSDFNKVTQDSVHYEHKFHFCYIDEKTELKALDLSDQKITSIKAIHGLEQLTDLQQLHLEGNHIEKIEGMESLVNLKQLQLTNNWITSIEGLDTLPVLEVLSLSYNYIEKITNLENLSNLKELYIYNNKIKKIEGFENLKNLILLSISSNQIPRIENLSHLTNLRMLNLNWNRIEYISGLASLTQLEALYLGGNRIGRIEGLETLKNVKDIDLFNNLLTEKPDLSFFAKLEKCNLANNPYLEKKK